MVLLIQGIHLSPAITRWRSRGAAGIAVVEEGQRGGVDIVRVVLVREPWRGARWGAEVATLPQPPDDMAVAVAVRVVDFDDPVLVAQRQGQVVIRRGPTDLVGV